MPSKSMNQIKKDKAFKTIAVFAMVFLFVASLIMAIVLPFVDAVGVAEAYSAISSAENEPVYPDTAKSGAYIDFSGLKSVPFTDINSEDFLFYGFYYDVNAVLPHLTSYNSSIFMYNATGSNVPFSGPDKKATLQLFSSSIGVNANFMYSTNGGGSKTIALIQTDSPKMVYSLNGMYFGSPMHFTRLNGYALFGLEPDYFKHWYAITSTADDALAQVISLKQENAILQQRLTALEDDMNMTYLTNIVPSNYKYFDDNANPNDVSTSSYLFMPNGMDTSLPSTEREYNVPINAVYSNNVNRPYLFGIRLNTTIPNASQFKISYHCLTVGQGILGVNFSRLWDLGYTYAFYFGQYGFPSIDNIGQIYVVDSFDSVDDYVIVPLSQPTSYVAFDIVSRDNYSRKLTGYFNYNADNDTLTLSQNSSEGLQWFYAFDNLALSYRQTSYENVYQDAYNDGFSNGRNAGYQQGFNAGVNDNNDYSFFGLIGAVFDAPISAFKGLLSFEVFGVDMTSFVSSLFALAIIVVIVKIALGGGK